MEAEPTTQVQEEHRGLEEEWANTEWFRMWLRLARREYQGAAPGLPEVKQAA